MAIANYTKKINGMRSIPQSHTIRSSKNYLKTTPERYMTPPDIFDLVLILRALMHHLSGIFGFLIGWGMTKNHFRIVSRERSLKCMLCSKCNGRLLLTFSGQKGRDLADRGAPRIGPLNPVFAFGLFSPSFASESDGNPILRERFPRKHEFPGHLFWSLSWSLHTSIGSSIAGYPSQINFKPRRFLKREN